MSNPRPEATDAVAVAMWHQWGTPRPPQSAARDALAFIRDALHRDGDDADAIRETLGLRREWSATDSTSVGLDMWPESGGSRAEAEAEFVHDGDDVMVSRVVGEWQETQP